MEDVLNVSSEGITKMLRDLKNDPMIISDLPTIIRRTLKDDDWSRAASIRIEGICRAHTRQILSQIPSDDILEATVLSMNSARHILEKYDYILSVRLSAWSDLVGDILYKKYYFINPNKENKCQENLSRGF